MTIAAGDWLVANIDMRGFYRVNYDPENWERLLTKLSSQHKVQHLHLEVMLRYFCSVSKLLFKPPNSISLFTFQDIPVINRAQIIDDAFNLAR